MLNPTTLARLGNGQMKWTIKNISEKTPAIAAM
jgi:hypothetical protein